MRTADIELREAQSASRENEGVGDSGRAFIIRLMRVGQVTTLMALQRWIGGEHYTTLDNYYRNRRKPSPKILMRLNQEKGLDLDWLQTGIGESKLSPNVPVGDPKRMGNQPQTRKVSVNKTIEVTPEGTIDTIIFSEDTSMGVLAGLVVEISSTEVILRPSQHLGIKSPNEVRIPLKNSSVQIKQ